jgi:hypothetical protein
MDEWKRQGAIRWTEGQFGPEVNGPLLNKILHDLEDRRIHDPKRQIDAISRQLEKVGTAAELDLLISACFSAKTHLGSWRIYPAIQGILEREDIQAIVEASYLKTDLIAPLLRDLSAEKAGQLALAFWNRCVVGNRRIAPSLRTRLWLAWNISEVDPQKALEIFVGGLECHDPALRLFSGMGILRLSDADTAPFLFTAPPEATKTTRERWLKTLTVSKPKTFRFPNPFALPLIKQQRGTRVDLQWWDTNGSVVREEQDVWPAVQHVLPDGTLHCPSNLLGRHFTCSLTSPTGETLERFPGSSGLPSRCPTQTGGFWGSCQMDTSSHSSPLHEKSVEYAPTGEILWAVARRAEHIDKADRGMILMVQGAAQIVNRRGDVVWQVQDLDAGWGCMLDSETVLAGCSKTVEIHHRTRGLLRRIDGFKAVDWIRYHPQQLWMIFDAGAGNIVIYDPHTDQRTTVRIGWTNDDPSYWSKWLPKGKSNRYDVE